MFIYPLRTSHPWNAPGIKDAFFHRYLPFFSVNQTGEVGHSNCCAGAVFCSKSMSSQRLFWKLGIAHNIAGMANFTQMACTKVSKHAFLLTRVTHVLKPEVTQLFFSGTGRIRLKNTSLSCYQSTWYLSLVLSYFFAASEGLCGWSEGTFQLAWARHLEIGRLIGLRKLGQRCRDLSFQSATDSSVPSLALLIPSCLAELECFLFPPFRYVCSQCSFWGWNQESWCDVHSLWCSWLDEMFKAWCDVHQELICTYCTATFT